MEFATQKIVSVKTVTPIEELSKLFGFSQLKKVSVVDGDDKLVGVVNRSRFNREILEGVCLAQ